MPEKTKFAHVTPWPPGVRAKLTDHGLVPYDYPRQRSRKSAADAAPVPEETTHERNQRHRQIKDVLTRVLETLRDSKDPAESQRRYGEITRIVKLCAESGDLEPVEETLQVRNFAADASDGPDYAALQRHADQQRLHGGVAEGTPEPSPRAGYGTTTYQPGLSPREMQPAEERGFEIDRGESFSSAQDYSALQRHADAMRTHWGLPPRTRGSDSSTAQHPDNNRADYLKIVAEVQASELRNGGLPQ